MSKPNLPDLPYSLLESLTGDEINEVRAYAEEAVRQALAAQVTTKHTSGPWRYEPGRDGRPPYVIRGTEGGFVVVGMTADRQEADACLIAAAPDLLLALERITSSYRSLLTRRPVRDVDETLAEVDAAIRKARGET